MELVSHGDMVSPVILHIATNRLVTLMKKAIHRIMAGIGFPRNFKFSTAMKKFEKLMKEYCEARERVEQNSRIFIALYDQDIVFLYALLKTKSSAGLEEEFAETVRFVLSKIS